MHVKEKKSHFGRGLAIYALVLLVLIFIGLALFWKFIAAYELSRPAGVVDRVVSEIDLPSVIESWAAEHHPDAQPVRDTAEALKAAVNGETLTYRKA